MKMALAFHKKTLGFLNTFPIIPHIFAPDIWSSYVNVLSWNNLFLQLDTDKYGGHKKCPGFLCNDP